MIRPALVTERRRLALARAAYRREYLRFRDEELEPYEGWVPVLLIVGLSVVAVVVVFNIGLIIVQGVEAPFREFQRLGNSLMQR